MSIATTVGTITVEYDLPFISINRIMKPTPVFSFYKLIARYDNLNTEHC